MKHALWMRLLQRLTASPEPLAVIDTHAGAGLYDLYGPMAQRSKEAQSGVARLMRDAEAPEVFSSLKAAVRLENPNGDLRFYPGSPLLTVGALRAQDRFFACELRSDDQGALDVLLSGRAAGSGPKIRTLLVDGYVELQTLRTDHRSRLVALLDPPYERGDERRQIFSSLKPSLAAHPKAVFVIWAPIKDLESLDGLIRDLETLAAPRMLAAQTRLRPLANPLALNGSAMIIIGGPPMMEDAQSVCAWLADACGEAGGAAIVHDLSHTA